MGTRSDPKAITWKEAPLVSWETWWIPIVLCLPPSASIISAHSTKDKGLDSKVPVLQERNTVPCSAHTRKTTLWLSPISPSHCHPTSMPQLDWRILAYSSEAGDRPVHSGDAWLACSLIGCLVPWLAQAEFTTGHGLSVFCRLPNPLGLVEMGSRPGELRDRLSCPCSPGKITASAVSSKEGAHMHVCLCAWGLFEIPLLQFCACVIFQ